MKLIATALLVIAISAAFAPCAAAQGSEMTWTVDGVKRVALVFGPPPAALAIRHPLVFVFHGHGGTMITAAQGTHIHTLWPEAIVVYPQGLPTVSKVDPQGVRPGWQMEAGAYSDRDLKFFDAMLATLRQKYAVNDQRIYATGFSNGAIFSYLLWAERGKVLAAFGICAGRLMASEHLTEPRSVLVIGGQADPILPFSDQEQAIEAARQVDGATGPGQPCGPQCTLYPSSSHTPVVTRIHPGGHVYPPWAAPAFVEFFKTHEHP